MLTKQDLNAIGNLIDTRLETRLTPIHVDIKLIKKDIKKLRKDLNTTIEFFDKNDHILLNKLNKTRSEVGLSELNFA